MSIVVNFTTLAQQALRDLGVLRPGQSASIDSLSEMLKVGNQMLDSWLLDGQMVYTRRIDAYTLVAGQQTYTIGPVSATFTTDRPTRIEYANIIINTVTPAVRRPVELITDQQWMGIRLQSVPSAIPTKLYYDGGFTQFVSSNPGFATIYLWPGPLTTYQLELCTWQQLATFLDINTNYALPPGYARAIQKGLAAEMIPAMDIMAKTYGTRAPRGPLVDRIERQARQARNDLRDYNSPSPILPGDPAFYGAGTEAGWNYALGEFAK